ncbi:hypothetical protein OEG84_05380 [Hoeflea sp. G2-23]|uniref:HEPN AbiU2-like domain-containing protein n=1 Tax=Hoeflea algicola TaxID=2983763 RepID=A0ABT3Z5Z2_9HYPH|nr:hypothetical protein [Hoeflea algicola]MCY0147160.1 hypothetical protein [Hoeflea algicola]
MTIRTAEEALQRYKEKMGDELGSTFHLCLQELYWVSSTWDIHETLFHDSNTVELINSANGGVSFAIQTVFFEYVQLGVCRLTDPATQRKSKNLTVRALPDLVIEDLKLEIDQLVSESLKATEAARDWRNRKISHSDFHLKASQAKPLKSTSRIATTEAIARIHRVLQPIALHYCETNLILPELGDNNAMSFLLHLFAGQQKKEADLEAVKSRDYKTLENRFPDWLKRHGSMGTRYDLDRILKVPREH